MKHSKHIYFILYGILLPLFLGVAIYFYKLNSNIAIPNWVKYNLPDGLWTFSFTSFILCIWGKDKSKLRKTLWIATPIVVSFAFEFSQLWITVGTFDTSDLLWYASCYASSTALYLLTKQKMNFMKHKPPD